jgi:hypothetical protein
MTCKECGCTTGGAEFCFEHAPYMVYPKADGSFISDRNGRKHISFDEPPAPYAKELEELLVRFRVVARDLLNRCGVPSNPAVTDDWILDELAALPTRVVGASLPVKQALDALEFAHGAILDAIGLDDELDGAAGAAVMRMIVEALVANGRTPPEFPKEGETVERVPFFGAGADGGTKSD